MLQNAYFLANIGADTAENEQHFAENLPKTGNYPAGPLPIDAPSLVARTGRGREGTVASTTDFAREMVDSAAPFRENPLVAWTSQMFAVSPVSTRDESSRRQNLPVSD